MRRQAVVTGLAAVVVVAVGLWLFRRSRTPDAPAYRFATVERGDVEAKVSATGTLGAEQTVEVGTQVSGQVAATLVDFNDRVKKGQLIARIDPILQRQAVQDAEAGVAKAQAQLTQTRVEFERNKTLHDQQIITDVEFNATQVNNEVAKAAYTSARIGLDRARQNLAYTNIYAPIDGVVVERNVDVGQTVAASLSAPKLFLIAKDLSKVRILASVDESDIGRIHNGLAVRFSVQAYPTQTFSGSVTQVRLNATVANNVVSYTVVAAVDNSDGRLLPGMTATVSFITGSVRQVLRVPNAALRFRPAAEAAADTSSVRAPATAARRKSPSAQGEQFGRLYLVGAGGALTRIRVRTGLSDGQFTEVSGPEVTDGLQVIVGINTGTAGAAQPTTSPFAAPSQRRPGGRPGPI